MREIAVGAEGGLFTPYLVEELILYFDSQSKGCFVWINARHTLAYFARAVLGGIIFSLKD